MGDKVVYVPRTHICQWLSGHKNGIWMYPSITAGVRRWPVGTVRQCDECGTTWVAGVIPGHMPSVWRREGRLERWMRTRREVRSDG